MQLGNLPQALKRLHQIDLEMKLNQPERLKQASCPALGLIRLPRKELVPHYRMLIAIGMKLHLPQQIARLSLNLIVIVQHCSQNCGHAQWYWKRIGVVTILM
jgi:hypothetical protein